MPTTRATHWRQRHIAIGRKGEYEADLLYGAEGDISCTEAPLEPNVEMLKRNIEQIVDHSSSPVSVASTLSTSVEMKPFLLPGSWVVVGKGGKPTKSSKMYDEPVTFAAAEKKKKKKKHRTNNMFEEAEPLVTLEDRDASLKCLRVLDRSIAQHQKNKSRRQTVKYWAKYQCAKLLKRDALNELIETLSLSDDEGKATDEASPVLPSKKRSRDNKANRNKDKARRRARSLAAAACCFLHDDGESAPLSSNVTIEEASAPQLSNELVLRPTPSAAYEKGLTEVNLPGAWTTVGKRGKACIHFPPLQPSKVDAPKLRVPPQEKLGKRHLPIEESPQKPICKREKKVKKCSFM